MDGLFVPFNAKVGRPRKFETPEKLLKAFQAYVDDRRERSIDFAETQVSGVQGKDQYRSTKTKSVAHPLSIGDFCIFLGCSRHWWNELPDEFLEVKERIHDYIYHYQLKGAEAGLFNANIVARELGLAEKKQVEASGDGVTIIVRNGEEKEKINNMGDLDI